MLLPNFTLSACLLAIQIHSVLPIELEVRQNNTAAIPRFNPLASDNVAVYFGHSPNNRNASLATLCSTPSINIIILGFVTAFNGSDKLPLYQLTSTCSSRSRKGMCPELAAHIQTCQSLGKKVFVSIGGSASNASFSSQQEAINAANTMWDLFGAGSGPLSLRPFGNVSVDGFDIDKEQGSTQYYDTFASSLKDLFASQTQEYYISAAPLCSNSSAILPPTFYTQTDFVWVRFYNALKCNIGSVGFNSSLTAWHDSISQLVGPTSLFPRLYVGGLSFANNQSGYVLPENFATAIERAHGKTRSRFGGVMLWDGTNGLFTKGADGETFINITKTALTSVAQPALDTFLLQVWDAQRSGLIH